MSAKKKKPVHHASRLRISHSTIGWMILSFFIALTTWVYIATTVNPNFSQHFTGIPVVVDITNTKAAGFGLTLLSPESEEQTVDVTVYGNRTAIGGLTKEDLLAYVDFDAATVTDTIGSQTLPVRLRINNGASVSSYELSQDSMDVTMDRFETKVFPVNEVQHSLKGSDSEVIIDEDNIVCEPAEAAIYGPTSALSLIDHVKVIIEEQDSLYQTKTFTDCTKYELVGADGSTVTDDGFQMQATRFSVKVPVFYTRTLPVTLDIYNPPVGFDTDQVLQRLRLSTDQEYVLPNYGENNLMINIETDDPEKKARLDELESWSLGSVPLSSLSLGGTPIEMKVTMEEGYTDRSNLGSVFVSLDGSNLIADERRVLNSEIQILNGSSRFDYTIQAGNTSFTLIGTQEEIDKITADDIQAYVNLYNTSVTEEGTFSQAVTIALPDTVHAVWVSPQPKVNITAVNHSP